jgi:Cu+-exporting ATPase
MTITAAEAIGTAEHSGRKYYFCSQSCLEKFRAHPEDFVNLKPDPQPSGAVKHPGTKYTHASRNHSRCSGVLVRSAKWRSNPEVTGEEVTPELVDMSRRFWISTALTAPMDLLRSANSSRAIR